MIQHYQSGVWLLKTLSLISFLFLFFFFSFFLFLSHTKQTNKHDFPNKTQSNYLDVNRRLQVKNISWYSKFKKKRNGFFSMESSQREIFIFWNLQEDNTLLTMRKYPHFPHTIKRNGESWGSSPNQHMLSLMPQETPAMRFDLGKCEWGKSNGKYS